MKASQILSTRSHLGDGGSREPHKWHITLTKLAEQSLPQPRVWAEVPLILKVNTEKKAAEATDLSIVV